MIRNNLVLNAAAAITLVGALAFHSRAEDGLSVLPEPKDAAEVFERYAKAVGGMDAIKALKTRMLKGTVEIPSYNISGTTETFMKAPNLYASSTSLFMGSYERGFNGTNGWSKNSTDGLKEESGIELDNLKEEAELQLPARMNEFFPDAKLKGKQKRNNTEVYVVEIRRSGQSAEAYFDVKTGLLIGWKKPVQTQNGTAVGEQTLQDYRVVDGVKVPFLITMVRPDVTAVIKVSEVKHNIEIPAAKFFKPAK